MNMNIRKIKNLNESQQQVAAIQQEASIKDFELFEKNKSITFDNGCKMGTFSTNPELKINLSWHFANTENVDQFIFSVDKFVSITGSGLSNSDILKLKALYKAKSK